MKLSSHTLTEIQTLLQCAGPSAAQCSNCICNKIEDEVVSCRYESILNKLNIKAREVFEPKGEENDK